VSKTANAINSNNAGTVLCVNTWQSCCNRITSHLFS